jgi:hypothetical protein
MRPTTADTDSYGARSYCVTHIPGSRSSVLSFLHGRALHTIEKIPESWEPCEARQFCRTPDDSLRFKRRNLPLWLGFTLA